MMADHQHSSPESIVMAALSTLNPAKLADLIHSVSSLFHLLHRRLYSILSFPMLYDLTIRHLQSLSLQEKSLLIARHLLSNLTILTHSMQAGTTSSPPQTYFGVNQMKLRDIDAVVLLLLLCEIRHLYPEMLETHQSNLRLMLYNYVSRDMLSLSGIETSGAHVLMKYIETVAKCKRFVNVMGGAGGNGGGGKVVNESATSVAIIVTLPSVEVKRGNTKECVICKEDMKEGRDVCELPCDHLFHWMCILPWLKKNNTCPCCRYRLPTDDVFSEVDRLWEILVNMGSVS